MKKKTKPARNKVCVLAQLCKFIPSHAVSRIARELGDEKKARTFSAWSHVVALLYAQLCHSVSLADVCDAMALRVSRLSLLRGATPPARNTLSHANTGVPKRFKRAIHAVDSSTIALVANCIDWAKHRRRKAAAKLHLTLNLQTFLPTVAVVEEASHHDNTRARVLCAPLREGEIVLFDKAYIDFSHLFELDERGIWWVTRAKDNMQYRVVRKGKADKAKGILRDDIIRLKGKSREAYPRELRRVVALVEIDGNTVEMVFITNNLKWAPRTVADLYLAGGSRCSSSRSSRRSSSLGSSATAKRPSSGRCGQK